MKLKNFSSPWVNQPWQENLATPYQIRFQHRPELWAFGLSGSATFVLLLVLIYEVFALTRICQNLHRISRVMQTAVLFNQLLLFGIFLSAIATFSFVIIPNTYSCGVTRFLTTYDHLNHTADFYKSENYGSIAYVHCYGILLTKLLALVSLMRSQYLGGIYQAFVLVLMIIVQAAICTQWLIYQPPKVINHPWKGPVCDIQLSEHTKIMIFPMILILTCIAIGLPTAGNPHLYRETAFITLSMILILPAWVVWLSAGFLLKEPGIEEASAGYGLIAHAFILLMVMFMAPARQKAVTGRGCGIFSEDIILLRKPKQELSRLQYRGNLGAHDASTSDEQNLRHGNSKQSSPDSGIASSSNHHNLGAKKAQKGEISLPILQQTLLIPKPTILPPKPPRNVPGLSRDVAGLIWARKQMQIPGLGPEPPSVSQGTLDAKPMDFNRIFYPMDRRNLITDVLSSTETTQDYAETIIGDSKNVNFDENVRIIIPESTNAGTEILDPCPHLNLTQYYHINPPDRARFGRQTAG